MTTFKRGTNPFETLSIGSEYYRQKKIEAVKNQRYEEAAKWRNKEKECLERDET